MADLQATLDIVNFKCWYYKSALEAGSEKPVEAYIKKERILREEPSPTDVEKMMRNFSAEVLGKR